jgi:D-glycero-alpha-D-manno-heptose 1-phosphate guanylyltransferase
VDWSSKIYFPKKIEVFEAVILMGGFGTRLKEISGDIPKPMVQIGGQPFVYHLMKKLESAGCSKIILSLHYNAQYIIQKISSDKPVSCEIQFVVEDTPLDTGGALKLAAQNVTTEFFIAINGHTISDFDYLSLFESPKSADIVIAAVEVKNTSRYGSLLFDSEMSLLRIKEKGIDGPGFINSGTYLIKTKMLLNVKEEAFSLEGFYLPVYKPNTKIIVFEGYFIDIGIPEDYHLACKKFA